MQAFIGFGEILMLLMLGGYLGGEAEPMPVEQALAYLPAECEVIGFIDLRGAGSAIERILARLHSQEWLIGMPEVGEALSELSEMVGMTRSQSTVMFGFDPFSELQGVAGCFRLDLSTGMPLPEFILVAQGTFGQTSAANLANQIGLEPAALPSGVSVYQLAAEGMQFLLATPAPTVLLFGSRALVEPLATVPPDGLGASVSARPEGGLRSRVDEVFSGGGMNSLIGIQLSEATTSLVGEELPVSFSELLRGMLRVIVGSTSLSGVIEVTATGAEAFRRYSLILQGWGAYSEGFVPMARGFLYLAAGLLSANDPDLPRELRTILAHRDVFLAFVEAELLSDTAQVAFSAEEAAFTARLTTSNQTALQSAFFGGFLMGFLMSSSSPAYHEEAYGTPEDYEYRAPVEVWPSQ